MIDLRSDTLTRPTDEMRRAMARADVGDDVYDEDPTVQALQERVASMFGFEAALFAPTGTMANVLAVAALVRPGEEILAEARAHILRAELGAHAALGGVTTRTWHSPKGQIDLPTIQEIFAPDMGPNFVTTAAVSVENTHNFAGGTVLPLDELRALRGWADSIGTRIHMDGARIWNAHVATRTSLRDYGAIADTLAVCLSKGLGAPIGSLMLGSTAQIAEARVLRKRLGGGMRQVGMLAAAGLFAIENHIERLADDHAHARLIGRHLGVESVPTNIVVAEVPDAPAAVHAAGEQGVLVSAVGPRALRLVTHLGVDAADAQRAADVLARVIRPA